MSDRAPSSPPAAGNPREWCLAGLSVLDAALGELVTGAQVVKEPVIVLGTSIRGEFINARRKLGMMQSHVRAYWPENAKAEIDRLNAWVRDLQSGMWINCVYCGHRYGPSEKVAGTIVDPNAKPDMQETLKRHIAECPKHPLRVLLRAAESSFHALSSLRAEREGLTDDTIDGLLRELHERVEEVIPGTLPARHCLPDLFPKSTGSGANP